MSNDPQDLPLQLPKLLSSQLLHGSRRGEVRKESFGLNDGTEVERCHMKHPGAVAIIAITPAQELVMIRQYRYSVQAMTLEIPAGTLNDGEDPLLAAQRELGEEAGYSAEKWTELGLIYPALGLSDERMYYFLAEDLHSGAAHPEDDEVLQHECIALEQVEVAFSRENIQDGKTRIAFDYLRQLGLLMSDSDNKGIAV